MLKDCLIYRGRKIPNRVVIQPMEGCDCNGDGSPSGLTREKYLRAARSRAGIVWFEANAVCPEGRTNPRQMFLTKENVGAFRALLGELRAEARAVSGEDPLFILQLTHSGRQSARPMIPYHHSLYEQTRPVGDDSLVSDAYLDALPSRYADSTAFAKEAGFDGVDVKSCHGYLLQELLSAYSREGKYGGCFENRTRLYLDCLRAALEAAGDDLLVVTRLGVSDMIPRPYGFGTDEAGNADLSEPFRLIEKVRALGVGLVNVTIGNPYYNPHVNRPFLAGPYSPPEPVSEGLGRFERIERAFKQAFPDVVFVASGLSCYRGQVMERAEKLLADGICDLVGFGRESLAYPEFYADYLADKFDPKHACVACSKCTLLMRNRCVSGCAVFNEYYRNLFKEQNTCRELHW